MAASILNRSPFPMLFLVHVMVLVTSHPSEGRTVKRDVESSSAKIHGGDDPIVYLTVSSLASKSVRDRFLELNWENLPQDLLGRDNVRVNLYNKDPRQETSVPLVSVMPTSKGFHRTSIRFPHQIFTRSNLTDSCLGYWIAFLNNDEVLSTNCIRARPHWMYENRDAIGNRTLIDIMLPGTHNTGSYASFDPSEDTMFNRYLFTQDETIWNQLAYGIRYLDLRVAYQAHSREKFWITHSSFRLDITVRSVIEQVKAFLDATQEIVIMDFHRFVTGFEGRRMSLQRRHEELVTILQQELGEYMIPVQFTSGVTLNHLWETGKRLYVGYANERARARNRHLFPAIKHLWGDVDDVDDLKSYLNETVCNPDRVRITSAMAQLTPTVSGVLFNAYGGLRKMADEVNRHVTKWFRNNWNHCANIVATDFFLGNNIIELSIQTNRNKLADSLIHFQ